MTEFHHPISNFYEQATADFIAGKWDFSNLLDKRCLNPNYATLGAYWSADGYVTESHFKPQFSESEYWGDRYLIDFAGRTWTPYQLPLIDPGTRELSPKHPKYEGPDKWSTQDFDALWYGLQQRVRYNAEQSSAVSWPVPHDHDSDIPSDYAPIFGLCWPAISFPFDTRKGAAVVRDSLFLNLSTPVTYSGEVVESNLAFQRCHFDTVQFNDITFSGILSFNHCRLQLYGHAYKCTYMMDMHLNDLNSHGGFVFNSCNFNGNAGAQSGSFSHLVLTDSSFSGTVGFESCKFESGFQILNCEFGGDVDFSCPRNETMNTLTISGSRFEGRALFRNRIITGFSHILNSRFLIPPAFFGSLLPKDFTLERVKFGHKKLLRRQLFWRLTRQSKSINETPWMTPASQMEGAFRYLRKQMREIGAEREEILFRAYEIECGSARRDMPVGDKIAAAIYGVSSAYGQSATRPMSIALFVLPLIALLLYPTLFEGQTYESWPTALGYFFAGSMNPFTGLSISGVEALFSDGDKASWVLAPVVAIHRLFDGILLFLTALAIRRRFQIS